MLCFASSSSALRHSISVLLEGLDESGRLCGSLVVTFLIAVTSAWKSEQNPGSLKDELPLCGKLLAVVKKPDPTPLSVREPAV